MIAPRWLRRYRLGDSRQSWALPCGCSLSRTPGGGWLAIRCEDHWLD